MPRILRAKKYHFERYATGGQHTWLYVINYGSGSSGNAIIFGLGNYHILLDAGVNPRRFMSEHLNIIDFALVTHEHQDHAKYVKDLIAQGIDVFMSHGTVKSLGINPNHRVYTFSVPSIVINRNDLVVEVYPANHDAKEPAMFVIICPPIKILYAVDTFEIDLPVTYQFTHVIIEANYQTDKVLENYQKGILNEMVARRILHNHMSINKVIDFLKTQKELQQVYLTHLSKNNADPDEFKKLVQEAVGVETYVLKRREEL